MNTTHVGISMAVLGLITWSWGRGWNDFREIKFTKSKLKVATFQVHTGKVRIKHSPWSLVHLSPSKMRVLVQSYWAPWGDGSFNSWSSIKMQSLLNASSLPQPLTQRLRGIKPIKKMNPKVLNSKSVGQVVSFLPHFNYERGKRKEKKGSSHSAYREQCYKEEQPLVEARKPGLLHAWMDAAYITVAQSFLLTTYKIRKEMHKG